MNLANFNQKLFKVSLFAS